jgi:hypothetical protein
MKYVSHKAGNSETIIFQVQFVFHCSDQFLLLLIVCLGSSFPICMLCYAPVFRSRISVEMCDTFLPLNALLCMDKLLGLIKYDGCVI